MFILIKGEVKMSKFKINDLVEIIDKNIYYNGSNLESLITRVVDVRGETITIEIDGWKYEIRESSLQLHKKYMTDLEIKLEELKVSLESNLKVFQEKNTDDVIHEIGSDDPHGAFQLGWDEGHIQGQLNLIEELKKSLIV